MYYYDNPEPLSLREGKIVGEINSTKLYDAIEETIISKLIRYAEDGDKKIINTIMIFGVMNVLAIGIVGYVLYTQIQGILDFINENSDVMKAIKEMLINGGAN